ncbi:hypothetical protein NKY70_25100 [Sinorhizobium meliloti]|uniref:hypothetical protein n=1 Tax=Rhizobium meliloti TaxID=382 RepID=UPI003D64FADB
MSPAPTIGASVAVSYALTPGASLYLPGSFDRAFHSRGDKERNNFATSEIESFVSRKRGGVTAGTMLVWDSAPRSSGHYGGIRSRRSAPKRNRPLRPAAAA